jgi:hypothetical protein
MTGGSSDDCTSPPPGEHQLVVPQLMFRDADLNRDFPSTRGLWQQTVQDGNEVWTISPSLKPGDILYNGKLEDCFTNEQHWDLVRECRITNALRHGALLSVLQRITAGYEVYGSFDRANGTLVQHKDRMAEMSKVAKRLLNLVRSEPLMYRLLSAPVTLEEIRALPDPFNFVEGRERKFLEDLGHLQERTADLVRNEEKLREWRISNPASAKSSERIYIWEPFFEFWVRFGHELRYSDGGPLIRIIRIIHKGLGIVPPKGPSVRQAINEFKRKPRAVKKLRPK